MPNQAWEAVKKQLAQKVPAVKFDRWIRPLVCTEEKGGTLVIECPNRFFLQWIQENYADALHQALQEYQEGLQYFLRLGAPGPQSPPPFTEDPQLRLPSVPAPRRGLIEGFTFDRFIVGRCNEFAYSAAQALIYEEAGAYHDVLFVFANTGLGKSHLSQAVGHAIYAQDPKLKVQYVCAEEFLNQMITALKTNQMEQFKARYRECDILLLEEIHFLAGKEKTQVELAYTMDMLITEHKKVVFTSLLLPHEIPNLRASLRSRLSSGIVAKIDFPDEETRRRLIEQKANDCQLILPPEVVEILAMNLTDDIRQLNACIKSLKVKSSYLKQSIDEDLARELVAQHAPPRGVSPGQLLDLVCKYFKLDRKTLQGKSRKATFAFPRALYAYLARKYSVGTLEEIGREIGRDHATVIYACETIEHKLKTDDRVLHQVEFFEEEIKRRWKP